MIACRDVKRGEEAAQEIIKQTGHSVTTVRLDLASLESIRTAAEELKSRHPQIHLLINNAGTTGMNRRKREMGGLTCPFRCRCYDVSPVDDARRFRDAIGSEPFGPLFVDAFAAGQCQKGHPFKNCKCVIARSRKFVLSQS